MSPPVHYRHILKWLKVSFWLTSCNLCSAISEAAKGKVKLTVETVTLQVNKDKEIMQEKTTKAVHTLFQKKEQKKGSEAKEADTNSKVAANAKAGLVKTQSKQEASVKKTTTKDSSIATKTSRPTVAQVLLKNDGRKQVEARKGKTTVLTSKKGVQKTDLKLVKEGTAGKTYPKSDHLKDQPHTNVTQSNVKNGTAKIVTVLTKVMGTNKTRAGKESLEQSTLAEKNGTQSSGHKRIKKVKAETTTVQSVGNRVTEAGNTGREKVIQKSQYLVNTTFAGTSGEARVLQDKTTTHGSVSAKKMGGSGLGSVKVVNISSYSFTVTWSSPQGMFKNFTVIRRELKAEGDDDDHEEFEEEALEGDKTSTAKNVTEVQVQSKSTNTTAAAGKAGSKSKAETKRISMVVPGSVRSVEFSNLKANTGYVLHVYGSAADRRSKIHRVTAVTGNQSCNFCIISPLLPWK